jgi:hypothetical protein
MVCFGHTDCTRRRGVTSFKIVGVAEYGNSVEGLP